jgi:hypothetical protein
MENAKLLLPILSAAVALAGTVLSIMKVGSKSRAEREYLRLLNANSAMLLTTRIRVMNDGVVSEAGLTKIIEKLEQTARGLSAEDRRLVATGLHQHSVRGRARYAAKLMNKAGIGSGPLLVAAP